MTPECIFSTADILLPDYVKSSKEFEKWSVIACDQFTSDLSYWNQTESIINGTPSTYDYILPEAFLGTDREAEKTADFKSKMSALSSSPLTKEVNGYIYIERTLSDGKIRRGILGKLDLEHYDYAADSSSAVRATEQTVAERIPARRALRAEAVIELPHIMVFADDVTGLFETAKSLANEENVLYDFELMQGGGHIKGYAIEGELTEKLVQAISKNESSASLPYAVGDGNHSLAAAKSHFEMIKAKLGKEVAMHHPARYALCEVVSIYDEAIEFEPIHRILKGVDVKKLLSALGEITSDGAGDQSIRLITADAENTLRFTKTTHDMTVGTLQNFIDAYLTENAGVCDYIHGESELRALAENENSVAFMFEGFDKSKLFTYIKNGPMPRKTFSMGDARSKRYYLEARRIAE
ncbi:MAG: DUF1015 family protein [Clostridia bacterium]|nr:DUF1015 family protein [Clostridia bacterium]